MRDLLRGVTTRFQDLLGVGLTALGPEALEPEQVCIVLPVVDVDAYEEAPGTADDIIPVVATRASLPVVARLSTPTALIHEIDEDIRLAESSHLEMKKALEKIRSGELPGNLGEATEIYQSALRDLGAMRNLKGRLLFSQGGVALNTFQAEADIRILRDMLTHEIEAFYALIDDSKIPRTQFTSSARSAADNGVSIDL